MIKPGVGFIETNQRNETTGKEPDEALAQLNVQVEASRLRDEIILRSA